MQGKAICDADLTVLSEDALGGDLCWRDDTACEDGLSPERGSAA